MQHVNFEVKARTSRLGAIRRWLLANHAEFRGVDVQTDTYFHLPESRGRLKLREGNIENSLIHYRRPDNPEARVSDVALAPAADPASLKGVLERALGVLTIVRKKREIYFIGNVKFHLDELEGIGQFVEIEAIATGSHAGIETLKEQCLYYMDAWGIGTGDIAAESYSDMVMRKSDGNPI